MPRKKLKAAARISLLPRQRSSKGDKTLFTDGLAPRQVRFVSLISVDYA